MDRQQLAHLLRAASKIADDPDIVVFGSQSILGSYDEDARRQDRQRLRNATEPGNLPY